MYFELPRQDSKLVDRSFMVKKAMYGAREAPQIWGDAGKEQLISVEFRAGQLHPPVCWNEKRGSSVVVHADEILCIGGVEAFARLYDTLRVKYDLKKRMLGPGSPREVENLTHALRRGNKGWDGNEIPSMRGHCCWSMVWYVRVQAQRGSHNETNRKAQGRPDLVITARVLSQRMAPPTEGTALVLSVPVPRRGVYISSCCG